MQIERLGSGRTIQVDVRVIAATNQDLWRMVQERKFRADLYFRLNVFPIMLPPLRERKDDIPLLIEHFVRKFATRQGKSIHCVPDEVMEMCIRDSVWSARPDGSVDFFNQLYLDYAGLSAEQAIDWGWTVSLHPDDQDSVTDFRRAVLDSGKPGAMEARLRRFDGEYRWFLFRVNPVHDESGKVVKWYGTNADIEDRRRAEEALRAREQDLSLIIETIPGLVWCAAPDGELNYLNRRMLDYTGTAAGDWAQFGWTNFFHPDDVEPTMRGWSRAVATGTPYEIQCRLRRSDGCLLYTSRCV